MNTSSITEQRERRKERRAEMERKHQVSDAISISIGFCFLLWLVLAQLEESTGWNVNPFW